jgi:hypothetical protein
VFSDSDEPRERDDDRPFEAEITTLPSSRPFVLVFYRPVSGSASVRFRVYLQTLNR